MADWQPIETAPKDGTPIVIGWKEPGDEHMQEYFTMQWGHVQKNGFFPGVVGMWVAPDGSMTWQDRDEYGPTHWATVESVLADITAKRSPKVRKV